MQIFLVFEGENESERCLGLTTPRKTKRELTKLLMISVSGLSNKSKVLYRKATDELKTIVKMEL